MLKVTVDLWPHDDAEFGRPLAEVGSVNVTADTSRFSRDYAWRIRETSKGIDANPMNGGQSTTGVWRTAISSWIHEGMTWGDRFGHPWQAASPLSG